MKKKSSKIIIVSLLVFALFLFVSGIFVYNKIYSPAFGIEEPTYIYIDREKNYAKLLDDLDSVVHLKNIHLFNQIAKMMDYPKNMRSGKYEIRPEMNYLDLVRKLRSGAQTPIKLTFNNIRLKQDLSKKIGGEFLFGSVALSEKLSDVSVCETLGFDTATIVSLFIPNTYEIYWDIPVDRFLERMKKEYNSFWTNERLEKARKLNLSLIEVSILASIVEEETSRRDEYPIVAGLYLNRLKKGMLLQADPTVKFAVGDVTLKRILNKHLQVDSPYNTYKYSGLPPAPIRIPSIQAIDAVLNYTSHNYFYMCAKEDFSGRHNFAVTLNEHNRNAQRYRSALNRAGIR